jgi:DNA-binding SARP family transcriptional activator
MTELTVTTFGGVAIQLGEQVLTSVLPVKAAALLVYALRQGRAQTREHLAALLWPESSQERASGNLRMALAGLREHVPSAVEITRTEVRAFGALDASTFDAELDALKAELSGGRKLSAESLLRLDAALRLYGGDFMAQFALNDSRGAAAAICGRGGCADRRLPNAETLPRGDRLGAAAAERRSAA